MLLNTTFRPDRERVALDLRRYERLKNELADLLRAVPWRIEQAERHRDLFGRLAEDRFNLAVVGRFSRGKSTLMNAMLGLDRLPTGIEPLTSVITSISYGSREKVVLHFQDTTLFLDIRLDQLEDYVTERGNPGNRRRIREAEIQLPADLLRSGFRFIDTPGLGSPVAGNTATTRAFLPEADAFLLVTGFDGALTDEEAATFAMARDAGRRVFIVLNKADLLEADERRAAIGALRVRLRTLGLHDDETVYPVSARDALAARLGRMPAAHLDASGLATLETDVVAFLTRGKRRAFLDVMCARLDEALSGEPEVAAAHRRLQEIRSGIDIGADDLSAASGEAEEDRLAANPPGCAVCHQAEQAVFDELTQLQNRLRRDQDIRIELVQQGGLCGPHARQFAAHAAAREVCTGFAPVLDDRAIRLRRLADNMDQAGQLAELMPGRPQCRVCRVTQGVEEQAMIAIAMQLHARPAAVGSLATLCLPHLAGLVPRLAHNPVVPALLRRQAQLLERRSADMRRFALKQDASLRDRISDEERHAAREGLAALAGAPSADGATAGMAAGMLVPPEGPW